MRQFVFSALALVSLLTTTSALLADHPIVIAHRGASGYLPEHTLAATALAYGQGADFIEQDLVLSRDGVPVVLHDIHIDTVTDVAERYPKRHRSDGRFYAIDFTLQELRTLSVVERFDVRTGNQVFPKRFPGKAPRFSIATLEEAIQLIQGLNKSTARSVGIYPEIKEPAWHRQQGQDISRIVLQSLQRFGYHARDSNAYLQCFDQQELLRIRGELKSSLKLVQLISTKQQELLTSSGLRRIASYAQGVGPHLSSVIDDTGNVTGVVARSHEAGLQVHPYTFRADALPKPFPSLEQLLAASHHAKIDGLFTDFPDRCVKFFEQRETRAE